MTTVRIYQPLKSTMQSGQRKTQEWILSFESHDPALSDPLMGWTSSRDMGQELHLVFPTLFEAIQYAKSQEFHYTVHPSSKVLLSPKTYGTNFTCPRVRG